MSVYVWKGMCMERHTHHAPFHRNKNQIQILDFHVRDDFYFYFAKNTTQIEKFPLFYKFTITFSFHLYDDFDKISTPFKTT
jgi:hypothetical protein